MCWVFFPQALLDGFSVAPGPPALFSMVFGVFSVAPGHPAQIWPTRRTPQGGIQGSFLPLEEPSSETLLGKKFQK